jgi:hypothetical protein
VKYQEPNSGESGHWRAVCSETCKHGSGEGGWKRSRRRLTVTAIANGPINETRQKPRTSSAAHPTGVSRSAPVPNRVARWASPLDTAKTAVSVARGMCQKG